MPHENIISLSCIKKCLKVEKKGCTSYSVKHQNSLIDELTFQMYSQYLKHHHIMTYRVFHIMEKVLFLLLNFIVFKMEIFLSI